MSEHTFSGYVDTVEIDGITFRMSVEADDSSDAPWDIDCFTPKPDERRRNGYGYPDKRPGETVVWSDRHTAYALEFAAMVRSERKNGGCSGSQAHKNACAVVKRLRAWFNDEWHYCGVVVTATVGGLELASSSLWGIESNAGDYLTEASNELLQECMTEAKARAAELIHTLGGLV